MLEEDVRIINPSNPLKFIRSTGEYRSSGSSEKRHYVADRALQFAQEVRQEEIFTVQRKLFWKATNLVSRFVVELESGTGVPMSLAWDSCQQIIRGWTALGTKVPLHSGETEYLLRKVGEPLSRHLLKATTQRIEPTENWQPLPWWCSYGSPLVLCQYRQGELLDIGPLQQIEFTNPHDRSYGGLYSHNFEFEDRSSLRGFFLERYRETDNESYAKLCMQLIRVHTERECLKQVFDLLEKRLIETASKSSYSNNVQEYIKQTIKIVLHGKSPYGLPKSETRSILTQGFDPLLNEDQWFSLQEKMSHIRPQLLEKIGSLHLKILTTKERGELRDLFIACAAVSDRERRNAIVGELPPNIAATITRSDDTNTDVLNILKTVRNFPGGLQKLVEAVELYEGATLKFDALQKGIQQILPGEIEIPEN